MIALAIAIFVVTYALIATERVHRVSAALGGAAALVLVGIVDADTAFYSEQTGVDWNVIFLLLGMMIIVSVFKQTGVFEYLAIWAAQRSEGRPFRLMVLLVVITAVASALLDNVTTVLLVAPVTFAVCARLGLPAVPYLIAQVFASNIGGTLAYDYGFNVETAGDHPVWHRSETDVFPGQKHDAAPEAVES